MRSLVQRGGDWQALREGFRWPKLRHFNITEAVCSRWARKVPERVALRWLRPDGAVQDWTFLALERASARLANMLAGHGLVPGDRLALLLPQSPEALLVHLACWRSGLISVPLFPLFGPEALRHRLADCQAKAVVSDAAGLEKIAVIRGELPDLRLVFSSEAPGDGVFGLWQEAERASDHCPVLASTPDDPAFIAYTSGTTGQAKGALHGHRVLLGHLPGIELAQDFLPQKGDCFWTPADWAWLGGLCNALLPSLYHGVPVVAHRMARFDPEAAVALIRQLGVRNVFLPPAALRKMRVAGVHAPDCGLRSAGSAGETLGGGMLDWAREYLGVTINEFYGQTECNPVLGNSSAVFAPKPGSAGRALPGHEVAILGENGGALADGEPGEIAVRTGHPAQFQGYWNQPQATAAKFRDGWLLTGDTGWRDGEGNFFFQGRADDLINVAGYRAGPGEIEECLLRHPSVAAAAAVGVPDTLKGEAVKVFVVLREGFEGDAAALGAHVRGQLAPHLAPREVVFVEELPVTETGKIKRRELRAFGKG